MCCWHTANIPRAEWSIQWVSVSHFICLQVKDISSSRAQIFCFFQQQKSELKSTPVNTSNYILGSENKGRVGDLFQKNVVMLVESLFTLWLQSLSGLNVFIWIYIVCGRHRTVKCPFNHICPRSMIGCPACLSMYDLYTSVHPVHADMISAFHYTEEASRECKPLLLL